MSLSFLKGVIIINNNTVVEGKTSVEIREKCGRYNTILENVENAVRGLARPHCLDFAYFFIVSVSALTLFQIFKEHVTTWHHSPSQFLFHFLLVQVVTQYFFRKNL